MLKVIELIRVSTEGQAAEDRASIPAQRAINRRTAANYGLEITRTIEITDVSGAAVLRAPEIQEMLRLIESPDIQGVVAREFSRLMRPDSFADYALLQVFADTKTILYLPEGPIDLSNKTGRLMGTIRAAIAGLERSEILERVWTAKEEKRRQGKLDQGKICLPFGVGYSEENNFYYLPEAERVRKAIQMFLAGEHNYQKLAGMVGVTPRGMHLILRNPIWMGWRIIDSRRDPASSARRTRADGRQGDRPKIKRASEDIIRVRVINEPLITEQQWGMMQSLMNTKLKRHWKCQEDRTCHFTYNGFLLCSECGELVYTYTNRKGRQYYVCKAKKYPKMVAHRCETKYMRREPLEAKLDGVFADRLTDIGFLSEICEEIKRRSNAESNTAKIARLNATLASLTEKRKRVMDSFIDGFINKEDRDKRIAAIGTDYERITSELMEIQPNTEINAEYLAEIFQPFFDWRFLNRQEKRRVVSSLLSEIKVANGKLAGCFVTLSSSDRNTHTDRDSWLRLT